MEGERERNGRTDGQTACMPSCLVLVLAFIVSTLRLERVFPDLFITFFLCLGDWIHLCYMQYGNDSTWVAARSDKLSLFNAHAMI